MHGSLLPKYRGRVPVNWAIIHGETETGATLHEMVEKPDAGRIVDQEAVAILPDELAVEVFRNVTGAAERVLRRSLPRLADGSAVLRAQDLSRGSYFGGRRPKTDASTGAPPRSGCTIWFAPSRRLSRRVYRSGGAQLRVLAHATPGAEERCRGRRVPVRGRRPLLRRLRRRRGPRARRPGPGRRPLSAQNSPIASVIAGSRCTRESRERILSSA